MNNNIEQNIEMVLDDYNRMESYKLLNRGYGSIPHLSTSCDNSGDKRINQNQENLLTIKTRDRHDEVIITEKVDGSNLSILKLSGRLYGVNRGGYDISYSNRPFRKEFNIYIEEHYDRFMSLLSEGERICGDWMLKTHSLIYDLPHEPFIAFDIMTGPNRIIYDEFIERCSKFDIVTSSLVHRGQALSVREAMTKLGKHGFHGCRELPEGVVYRMERHGKVVFLAKHVRSGYVPGRFMNDDSKTNSYLQF